MAPENFTTALGLFAGTLTTISLPDFVAAYFVIFLLTQVFPVFQPVAMVFPGMSFWAKLNAVALPVIVQLFGSVAVRSTSPRSAMCSSVATSAWPPTDSLTMYSPSKSEFL